MSDLYVEQLQKNYLELSESTGESLESIAGRVESHGDKQTAAWLRSRAAGEAPAGTDPETAAPQGRRAAGNGSLKTAAADAGDSGDGQQTAAAGESGAGDK